MTPSSLVRFGIRTLIARPLVRGALVLGALSWLMVVAFSVFTLRVEGAAALSVMPVVLSNVLAWGAGTMLAFVAALDGYRVDRREGIAEMLFTRGASVKAYFWSRAAAAALLVLGMVGGGTLLGSILCFGFARKKEHLAAFLQSVGASLLFSVGFAATLTAIACATLAPREKRKGYPLFLFFLLAPELLGPWLAMVLPYGWIEVTSISKALVNIRNAILPSVENAGVWTRSLLMLTVIGALAGIWGFVQARKFDWGTSCSE